MWLGTKWELLDNGMENSSNYWVFFNFLSCYFLHGILTGRKKNYNHQDGVLPAIQQNVGGLGSLFFLIWVPAD